MHSTEFKYFTLIFFITILIGCDSRKKEEKNADNQLTVIEHLIENNEYNVAKIKIDSFHFVFPRLVAKRKIAAALKDTIKRRESSILLMQCDSLYPIKRHEFELLSRNFRLEKESAYLNYGNYIHKSQIAEQNIHRNYLKCIVNENAELQLSSNFTGTKIAHHGIEVRAGDFFAATDSANQSNGFTHYFNDENDYFEQVTFQKVTAENIVKFIYDNKSSAIEVKLIGKKTYKYNLNPTDIKAIAESYQLWVVRKDILKLEKEIQKASLIINRINFRKINNI